MVVGGRSQRELASPSGHREGIVVRRWASLPARSPSLFYDTLCNSYLLRDGCDHALTQRDARKEGDARESPQGGESH
jgi:hypothetical protein